MKAIEVVDLREIELRRKQDILHSGEGWTLVSSRFMDALRSSGIVGWSNRPLGTDNNMSLLQIEMAVATDEALAGFESSDPCEECGRPRERLVGPLGEGMDIPADQIALFRSEIWNESVVGRYAPVFATEAAAKLIRKAHLKGLVVVEAL